MLHLLLFIHVHAVIADAPKPLLTDLPNPTAVALGPDGRIYIAVMGQAGKEKDGSVLVLDGDKAKPFASGLDAPSGMAAFQQWLFVAAGNRIWRLDRQGKAEVFVAPEVLPAGSVLAGLTIDPESGTLYASTVDRGQGPSIFRIDSKGKKASPVGPSGRGTATGLAMDGASHLLAGDFRRGMLHRIKLADGSQAPATEDIDGSALTWDKHGRLYVGDWRRGSILAIPRPGEKPIRIADGFQNIAGLALDATGKRLFVADAKAGTLAALPAVIPGWEVNEVPLPVVTEVAFPKLEWTGWSPMDDKGKAVPLRPILLTHAGDGTNRVFVPTQQGVIHVFPNDQQAAKTQIFLDISSRVRYLDNENEEGLLGLAFHPQFKTNREFFVFYTDKRAKLNNVVSRFRVSKDDANRADPDFEEEILRFQKPFWNHDGGTICFGPDGFLYVTHGDGGMANDPFENGQKLSTLLGKVLRIDVDRKEGGKNYAVPKDNPFVDRSDARPEIWAYGLRNLWRMAFDRKTGQLWAGEVGQNLYEEIVLIQRGGNYGWNLRESLHPFGPKGVGPRPDLIEPIWEYHHDIGKSITGGVVYRGRRLPELEGAYLYADYVSNKIWALRYDEAKKRVVANQPIPDRGLPILSFGEDEDGDVYFMTFTPTGKGIYRFTRKP